MDINNADGVIYLLLLYFLMIYRKYLSFYETVWIRKPGKRVKLSRKRFNFEFFNKLIFLWLLFSLR